MRAVVAVTALAAVLLAGCGPEQAPNEIRVQCFFGACKA